MQPFPEVPTAPRPTLVDDRTLPPVFRVSPDISLTEAPVYMAVPGSDAATMTRVPIHALKTAPQWFDEVWTGHKRAELRVADRPFAVGHGLWLREYSVGEGSTGRCALVRITHILDHEHIAALVGKEPASFVEDMVMLSIHLEGRYCR